jgi:hypothetical protein
VKSPTRSLNDKVNTELDPKGFAIKDHDRLRRRATGSPISASPKTTAVGSGHQLRIMIAVAIPQRAISIWAVHRTRV